MTGARRRGPSRDELLQAADRRVEPVVAPGLRVLFCGINPGLYTAWAGHHFARPGNRFWPTLHAAGFTPRLFDPSEQRPAARARPRHHQRGRPGVGDAAELSGDELAAGGQQLVAFVRRWRPAYLAVLGVDGLPGGVRRGRRPRSGRSRSALGDTAVWVLPNPSGLNAHWTPAGLAEVFAELREEVDQRLGPQPS